MALAGAAAEPAQSISKVPLGKSGLAVTKLSMGCEGIEDPDLIPRAADLGINYFHCFHAQGDTGKLSLTGAALKPIRDKVVLGGGWNDRTGKGLLRSVDAELRAFGTDRIDLWYMSSRHRPEHLSDECFEAMRTALKAGKIRACGVTTHNLRAILQRLEDARGLVTFVMVTGNYATWMGGTEDPRPTDVGPPAPDFLRSAVTKLHAAGTGIVAMKPMLGGLSFVPKEYKTWSNGLGSENERKAALASGLRWVIANDSIDTALVMMRNREELEANVAAAKQAFSPADEQRLRAALDTISPFYCRVCNACTATCKAGLPVPDVLRFLLYAEGYGAPARARADFRQLQPQLQSVRCADCSECTVHCPNGVRVREQLGRAQTLLGGPMLA